MGTLKIEGLSNKKTRRLMKKWRLQTGTPYRASYPREFLAKHLKKQFKKAMSDPKSGLKLDVRPNSKDATVDVTIRVL